MELLRRECGQHESPVLRSFLGGSEGQLERLQRDARTAEVRAAHTWPGTDHGHSWASTPCSAWSVCTPGHPHPALHGPHAHLGIHTLLCALLVHSCSSNLALHAPLAHLLSFACSVSFLIIHTLLYTFFVLTCTSTSCFAHTPHAHLLIHTLPCTLLVHIWSCPWLCMLPCTICFPLHAPFESLVIHTLLCTFLCTPLPCFAHT